MGTLAGLLAARRLGLPMWLTADALAPSLALGHAFGRIGCYLHGCCYGVPVHAGAWYGCVFPAKADAYSPLAPIPSLCTAIAVARGATGAERGAAGTAAGRAAHLGRTMASETTIIRLTPGASRDPVKKLARA